MNQQIQTQDIVKTSGENIDPRVGNPFYKGNSVSEKENETAENNDTTTEENIKITVQEESDNENLENISETSQEEAKPEISKEDASAENEEEKDAEEEKEVPISEQLDEFLSRNLFLEPELKQKILEADIEIQEEILPILTQMDEKQTDLFRKILEKNPHFFGDLENMAIRDALKKLVAREEQEHLEEIANAENELENMLNGL